MSRHTSNVHAKGLVLSSPALVWPPKVDNINPSYALIIAWSAFGSTLNWVADSLAVPKVHPVNVQEPFSTLAFGL